jgi:hypothetical protein
MPSEKARQAMLSGMRKTSNGRRAALENGTGRAFPRRMSEARKICCYGYVNRSYESVRDVLHQRPLELLQQATTSAAERANSLAASLRLGVAGIEIGVGVRIDVRAVREEEGVAGMSPVTRVVLGWEAASGSSLFPIMSAQLSAWPLMASETQLELEGSYSPPLGIVGTAIDAAVGHRIAEASVHRLLDDVIEQLRRDLPQPG